MQLPAAAVFLACLIPAFSQSIAPQRPQAGPVSIFHESDLRPGMKATAWTVFEGTEPEAVPIEIIGIWKNTWGPGQDVILGKMGGRAQRTNVAGGMSGSPVYIDGKLLGAVALRLSVFSPDAICGITPIDLMLEINDLDKTRPPDAKVPGKAAVTAAAAIPGGLLPQAVQSSAMMVPIETPLSFAGFSNATLEQFGPLFRQLGITAVAGGAGGSLNSSKPAKDWQHALNPGESVAGVLVSGDMSVTGLGTVTYNDGKRILAFGHPFFNLGPVEMPMSKGEVLMVLSSAYQPNKFANATEIVGALHQDRHSGIMGVLGEQAPMIPVTVKVRSLGEDGQVHTRKEFHMNVFEHQKWTPYLMSMTLFNSISGSNDFEDEATYRLSGKVEFEGLPGLALNTTQTNSENPLPASMVLAGWWGEHFNRLFLNSVNTPKLKSVDVNVDLVAERRVATIENAWTPQVDVRAGDQLPVKVFLRPYRGERIERAFTLKVPPGLSKGPHRILLSDADTVNRFQNIAGLQNRYIELPQVVSLMNQERSNNQLYVSVLNPSPTAYYDDKTLPSLPGSVINVMQSGRLTSQMLLTAPESAFEQMSLPFDYVVNGSYVLKINVK